MTEANEERTKAQAFVDMLDGVSDKMGDAESFLTGASMTMRAVSDMMGRLSIAANTQRSVVEEVKEVAEEAGAMVNLINLVISKKRAEKEKNGDAA